jgi:hypothetical protein
MHHSAIVFATADELASHPELVRAFGAVPLPDDDGLGPGEVRTQVTRLPNGAIAILIAGLGEEELVAGAAHLAAHHREMALPPPGWHAMIAPEE